MKSELYHYTESGLDNVFLIDGFTYKDTPRGRSVFIQNIDGLHKAIGRALIREERPLSPKEFRFPEIELLLSQRSLGKLLGVKELTVARWEKNETTIPRLADGMIRCLYAEHIKAKGNLTKILERIADLEDWIDQALTLKETENGWDPIEPIAA